MTADVKRKISWPRVLFQIHVHVLGLIGIWLIFTEAAYLTIFFSALLCFLGILGVTAGAHRLWAHRAYQANTSLKIFLMLCHTLVGHGSIYDWVVKHRLHHKHFGTDKDPYNRNKGFLYSHFITHVLQDTPVSKEDLKELNIEDIDNDAVVQFQKNFYWLLMPIICILLPVNAPMEYWTDGTASAIFVAGVLRYAITMHVLYLIHSAIHIWGLKPEDKYPADTMLVFILTKSHWPVYHYILPWDYQTEEFGGYSDSILTSFIRIMAALGWAAELRTVDSECIKDALYESVTTGKSVGDCVKGILDAKSPNNKEHFLAPSKFL